MKRMLLAAVIAAVVAGTSFADGIPSSAKLAQMGLSSMKVVRDQQGEQGRGKGFGAGYFSFRVAVQEGVFPLPAGPFVNNPVNSATATFVGAYTWGQDPRAAVGDLATGTGGIDPVAPGSPLTVNLATPQGVWTATTFGISFGNGN
jgi:hypothetical protein